MLILTIGFLKLAEAQCKKPKDEDTPHGANEFLLHDEGTVGRVHGRVFFPNYAIEAGRVHAKDIVVELYSYSGGDSYQDVNKVLSGQKRVAACVTGADGRFSFARLKPGRYLLRAGTRKRDQYNEIYVIFYERNNICEVGFGKETAAKVLQHPHQIVAAYEGGELVGLARATFDGLSAHVMEFSLDLRLQGGDPSYTNGSLIEADNSGVGHRLGERLRNELEAMGARFITCYIVANCEEQFYQSLGFRENEGHLVYYMDKRPYVQS